MLVGPCLRTGSITSGSTVTVRDFGNWGSEVVCVEFCSGKVLRRNRVARIWLRFSTEFSSVREKGYLKDSCPIEEVIWAFTLLWVRLNATRTR